MNSPRFFAAVVLCATALTASGLPAVAGRLVPPQSSKTPVTIIDIGGIGQPGGASEAFAISKGLVVGYALTAGENGQPNAVITNGTTLADIGAGIYGNVAFAINEHGVAAGEVFLGQQTQSRAVIFRDKREINLGTLPGDLTSRAAAINASGIVVGESTGAANSRAFVFERGAMHGIPALSALTAFLSSNASGINAAGTIVGSVSQKMFFGARTSSYAIAGGKLTEFAPVVGFGYSVSQPTAINAAGAIAGSHSTFSFSANAPTHAYVYADGTLTDYGTLFPTQAFANSVASAIDSAGIAVGYSTPSGSFGTPRAALFRAGKTIDLNTFLPKNSGWVLETANGIDDFGNIVGLGTHNAVQRGFILRTGTSLAATGSLPSLK